jgi:hypothetical protein
MPEAGHLPTERSSYNLDELLDAVKYSGRMAEEMREIIQRLRYLL